MDTIQVEIFGQTYTLKGGADAAYVRELAAYLNAKMREVQKGTGTSDGYRIAILAALNIVDELHRLRSHQETTQQAAQRSLDVLLELTRESGEP